MERYATPSEKARNRKGDSVKQLDHTRRTRELYKKGLRHIQTLNTSFVVRECATLKLKLMSHTVFTKSYAWHNDLSSGKPAHGKKSDFWCSLSDVLKEEKLGQFNVVGRCGFPRLISVVHIDVMNEVYKPPFKSYKCKTVAQCMLHTMIRRY